MLFAVLVIREGACRNPLTRQQILPKRALQAFCEPSGIAL
jgi:hypothetical protein